MKRSGRLQGELLKRVTEYGTRIVMLCEQLERDERSLRIVSQLIGSGTAAGANLHEAHEAMSRADFIKCLNISTKELSETIYWLNIVTQCRWVAPQRIAPLLTETNELIAILKTMIARTRNNQPKP